MTVDTPDRFVPPAASAAPNVAAPTGNWLTTGPHPIGQVGCEDNFCPPEFELGFGGFGGVNTGRVDSLVVIPSGSHAGRVVVGTAGGGVWVSDNGAVNGWLAETDNAPSLAIGALAVDPTNPDHLLAGTGEANQSGDSYPGFGMLASGDAGLTWTAQNPSYTSTTNTTYTATSATDTSANWTVNQWAGAVVRAGQVFARVASNTATVLKFTGSWSSFAPAAGSQFTVRSFDGEGIAQVAFDPGNALHMYAATSQGLFVTLDGGNTWAKPTDASYSTVDGNVTAVVVVPGSPGPTVYIGGGAKQLARSTDGGTTWATANSGMSLVASGRPYTALALAAGAPATLYASVGNNAGPVTLYRASDVPAITWTSVPVPDYTGNAYAYGGSCTPGPTTSCEQGNYDNAVTVDPANPNHILAAGETVVETTNAGASWQNINGTAFNNSSTNPLHPDQHAVAFAPDGSIWIGNDGGVYRYSGGQIQNENVIQGGRLADTQFYFGFTEVPDRGVLGGTQDNATTEGYPVAGWFGLPGKEIEQGFFGWQGINSGDGGPTALWQFTKNSSLSTYGLFEADQHLFINGPNFAASGSAIDITPTATTANTPFTPPMIAVPNSADAANPTVFFGDVDLWRTTNPIASPPTWTKVTSVAKNVSAIAAAPSDPKTVYVGFQDGSVQVSTDGGQSFTSLAGQPFAETWVTGISVNPQNAKQITVSVSYSDTRSVNGPTGGANPHVGQYLWSTSVGTGTWTVITGNLPPESGVSRVIYDNGALLAATDVGVYATTAANGDSTVWAVAGKGLPRVQVQDLYLDTKTGVLFAVTHGRGAWEMHKPIFGAAVAGDNSSGELGGGSTAGFSPAPYIACCPTNVKTTAAGAIHMLALLTNGTVMAWGADYAGQLGDGITATSSHVPVKVKLPAGAQVKAVAAGGDQSLALLNDGSILAWGGDSNGELGDGSNTNSNVPVQVKLPAGDTATAIAAGYNFSLALISNGSVLAWGSNDSGQLGNPRAQVAASNVPIPVQLPAGAAVTAIAAGLVHALGQLSDGTLLAWGANNYGQLGNGTTNEADTPVHVSLPAGASVTAISGGFNHSLAALASGGALAWGDNTYGELGNGTNSGPQCGGTCSDIPIIVSFPAGLKISAVAAGTGFSMALLKGTQAVQTWGTNDYGQLGTTPCCPPSNVPVTEVVPGDNCNPTCGVLSISAGEFDTELTITEGTVS